MSSHELGRRLLKLLEKQVRKTRLVLAQSLRVESDSTRVEQRNQRQRTWGEAQKSLRPIVLLGKLKGN